MKKRGSDREKGSAKSCQPEIKQAGTLPIPEPQHPPQSHILPLHSLHLSAPASIFRLSRRLCPFHGKEIYLKACQRSTLAACSCRTHRHTCVIRHASDQTCMSTQRRGSLDAAPPVWSRVCAMSLFACLPAALEGTNVKLRKQHRQVLWSRNCWHSEAFSAKEFSAFCPTPACLWHCRPEMQLSELLKLWVQMLEANLSAWEQFVWPHWNVPSESSWEIRAPAYCRAISDWQGQFQENMSVCSLVWM